MKIVVTSATPFEVTPLQAQIEKNIGAFPPLKELQFHVSGVGMLQSCFSIQKMLLEVRPDLVLQVGIAGALETKIPLGSVVLVEKEFLGSCGVMENDRWHDLFDLGLSSTETNVFQEKALVNPWMQWFHASALPRVTGVTIDEITTARDRLAVLQSKYNADIESMEGASLHYSALQYQIPFLQIRGISNYVGQRDKTEWKLKESITAVCQQTFTLLKTGYGL